MKEHKGISRNSGYGAGSLIKRGKYWTCVFWVNGKQVWRSTGETDRKAAERKHVEMAKVYLTIRERNGLQRLVERIAAMSDDRGVADMVKRVTVDELWERFSKDANRPDCGERNMLNYRNHLGMFAAWVRENCPAVRFAADVTQSVADAYTEHRRKTRSMNTANKDLNALSLVWKTLARPCRLSYNPWSEDKIIRRKVKSTSRRVLTDDEVARLVGTAEGELKTLMVLGRETPYRQGDCSSMKWSEVKTEDGVIAKKTSKTGAYTVCPISAELAEHLNGLERKGEYVMPTVAKLASASLSHKVSDHFRKCGIERMGGAGLADFHSFRHTWISRMIAKGVNPSVVQRVAGHANIQMTGHYTHFDAEDVKRSFGL